MKLQSYKKPERSFGSSCASSNGKLMFASFSFISEIDSLVEKKEMVKFYEFSYMYEFQEYFKSVGC